MTRGILGHTAILAILCATCAFTGGCKTASDSKSALPEMTTELVSSLPPGLDADAALAALDRAIAASPDNAVSYSNRATVYRDAKKDYPRALADYDKAVALAPGLPQVYMNRGLLRQLAGDPAHARTDYSKAIELDPKNATAFCMRGTLDRTGYQGDRGLADFTAALALDPRRADAFRGRGMAYARTGHYDLALEDLSKALKLNPDDYTAYHERGLVYLEGKTDPARALADMDRAIEADPQQPLAHADKARICEFLGRPGDALEEYRKVVKLASSAPPAVIEQARKRIVVLEDIAR
jgi:tetratricopeptide (TPR) repeat protein